MASKLRRRVRLPSQPSRPAGSKLTLTIVLAPEDVARVEAFAARQAVPVSRSAAAAALVVRGLAAEQVPS